ncbi:outer membrane protein assembly factor BamB family protein [Alicyclobacillus sp. ALC3]|uniref:outer membrane protein assembly factor BamB family protein n=1 Tax=Alicyclobacillus sp. ALC3 TaxID=2796143 RepID=UPI0023784746|nr:PQQ-binding-like beta-propeller repeat protein [Alicyclobacillus sp. ALC3]WDL95494.1 PQQ-binding-like beta-propeller repeat protein [Alicyclobacillus sp. ALC3]
MQRYTKLIGVGAVLFPLLTGCALAGPTSNAAKSNSTPPAKPAVAKKAGQALPYGATKASSILPGDVLIADSSNNRILLVTPGKKIVWQYPAPGQKSGLVDDDDVFFGPKFDEIITNEENNNALAIINFKSRKIVWQYGHPGVAGSAPGYLNTPDDAFLYNKGGKNVITVADIRNQRILFINRKTKSIIKQYGQTGVQRVNPPITYGAPNGDFPAPNGGMLVTQINGNDAIRLNKNGKILWTVHFPSQFSYPSDANFTPHGNVIVAFYTNPGAIVKMSPSGKVLWSYSPTSGPGELNHPSLVTELPNGMVLLNDDYHDRVIVINPKTNKIVWQYGHTGVPGTAPGYLHIPDGVDFLPAGITPGGNNPIGHHLWSYPGNGY